MDLRTRFESLKSPIPNDSLCSEAAATDSPAATYTISARTKTAKEPVFAYLRRSYGNISLIEIESIFGFLQRSTLYGGRVFTAPELSDSDVQNLNDTGIGVRIPMTNHYVEQDEYEKNRPLLERHHSTLNSIIVTNDDLARWIRRDYPHYAIDASVIKNIKTQSKIDEALQLYDSVVLPMRLNNELEFLRRVRQKERIILFANAGCALTCPSQFCYVSISRINKGKGNKVRCSQSVKERELYGMVDFPLDKYVEMGFSHFKLLRSRPNCMTGY